MHEPAKDLDVTVHGDVHPLERVAERGLSDMTRWILCVVYLHLFDFCVKYKQAATARGESTPIMDKLIFKGVRALLGGKVRMILAGGAPLR